MGGPKGSRSPGRGWKEQGEEIGYERTERVALASLQQVEGCPQRINRKEELEQRHHVDAHLRVGFRV